MGVDAQMFKNPEVKTEVAVAALIILVISGCIAGILPANRALKVKPVEALRYE
jgi:putative ABC transport system permease protein